VYNGSLLVSFCLSICFPVNIILFNVCLIHIPCVCIDYEKEVTLINFQILHSIDMKCLVTSEFPLVNYIYALLFIHFLLQVSIRHLVIIAYTACVLFLYHYFIKSGSLTIDATDSAYCRPWILKVYWSTCVCVQKRRQHTFSLVYRSASYFPLLFTEFQFIYPWTVMQ